MLLQLHQAQEELEALFLVDRDKSTVVAAKDNELNSLRSQLSEVTKKRDLRWTEKCAAEKLVEEQKAQLLEFIGIRNNRDETIASLQKMIKDKDDELSQAKEEAFQKCELLVAQLRHNKDETIASLQKMIKEKDDELSQAKEEAFQKCELLVAQLRQVEKELQHYFELARDQDKALQSSIALHKRSSSVIAKVMSQN